MINTNFRQGTFKKWDDLVIIDPCNTNAWRIVTLLDNYGKYEDINVIILYKSGEEYMKTTKMDTQFIDIFYHVYKIVREFCQYDWWTIFITIFKKG